MKVKMLLIAVVMGITMISTSAMLFADWHWIGAGADDDFSTPANWQESGAPPNDGQPIYLAVPTTTGHSTCTFDADYTWPDPGPTTITGAPPTLFVFTISGSRGPHIVRGASHAWCSMTTPSLSFRMTC